MRTTKRLFISMLTCGLTTGLWASSIPGALSGRFTINASGEKVLFSQGNLQYQASTNTWRFATNQYDYIGSANANISDSYTGWIDLFGWATNGLEANTATGKMPYYTGTTDEDYGPSITSGEFDKTIYDWGKAIDDSWHTLSNAEWNYIFAGRASYSSLYGFGRLFGVNGVFLLPDDWSWSETSIATAATAAGFAWSGGAKTFSSNIISNNTLWSVMESAGAVFIPAAGYRQGTTINMPGDGGDYWSSTASSDKKAYRTSFYNEHLSLSNNYGRSDGISVRLVRSSLDQDNEGYYLIGSAYDWKLFADIVNNGTNPAANAKLTANIDLGDDQTKIGDFDVAYAYGGIFDGQGHTLNVNYYSTSSIVAEGYTIAPFRNIKGATIKNITVTGSITGYRHPAGVVGYTVSPSTNLISNVTVSATINIVESYGGGFIGHCETSTTTIQDCLFNGTINGKSGGSTVGVFFGWSKSSATMSLINCLENGSYTNCSTFTPTSCPGYAVPTVTNCYYAVTGSYPGTHATSTTLADGTTTTALNAGRTGAEEVWVQDPLTNQPMLAVFAGKYTVPASGLGTFSAKANFTLPEGLDAYYCKDYADGKISVTAINGAVPANTGVILKGEPGETYTLTTSNETPATVTDNALVAVTEETTIQQTDGDYTNFGLSGGVFKKVNSSGGTVKANRAYLQIPTSELPPAANAQGIMLVWDEETDGIEIVQTSTVKSQHDDAWFTLDGRQLSGKPTAKGLYIVNGKKVIVK